ncbi:MAG: alpha-amylase family protein [Candidatus Brocadiia bacterium]
MHCPWFRDHMRQVHMDFHMPEFPEGAIVNYDPEKFVDYLERGRVNMVALFSKCHFGNSFYDTKVGHKHAGLEQDFLKSAAAECRRRDIKTLAYYSLCVDKRAWDANPDWRFKDGEGNTYGDGTFWACMCMNSPYKDELVMPQLAEIAQYPVDGFWLDIPLPLGGEKPCFCSHCQRKWKQELGKEISPNMPTDLLNRLTMRTVEDYLKEVRAIIDKHNPELVVAMNRVGSSAMSLNIKNLCEIGCWESQPRPGDYLGHSFAAHTARNDTVDVQVMSVRFYQGWGDLTLKPAAQMTTEFAAMIGNGAPAVSGDQVNVDGTLQPPVYEMFDKAFGFVEKREDLFKDAESLPHTAVLLPTPDPELPMHAAACDNCRGDWHHYGPWRGAHKMLIESHIQCDIVYSLLADDLSRFQTIILPEPTGYRRETIEKLNDFIKQGGTVIAIGKALINGKTFELEKTFGLQYIEPLSFSTCHFSPAAEVKGKTADIPLQVRGQAFKTRLTTARELAALFYPMAERQGGIKEFRSRYSPASRQRSPFPFASVNEDGGGKAVYVAASIFDIYWQTNHHWLRQFMEALIRYVDPETPVDIDGTALVETNLMQKENDLLLNLIHYALGHQGGQSAIAAVEKPDPATDITCRVRCENVEKVVLEPKGEEIPFDYDSGVCEFSVTEIEYLSCARLVGAASAG